MGPRSTRASLSTFPRFSSGLPEQIPRGLVPYGTVCQCPSEPLPSASAPAVPPKTQVTSSVAWVSLSRLVGCRRPSPTTHASSSPWRRTATWPGDHDEQSVDADALTERFAQSGPHLEHQLPGPRDRLRASAARRAALMVSDGLPDVARSRNSGCTAPHLVRGCSIAPLWRGRRKLRRPAPPTRRGGACRPYPQRRRSLASSPVAQRPARRDAGHAGRGRRDGAGRHYCVPRRRAGKTQHGPQERPPTRLPCAGSSIGRTVPGDSPPLSREVSARFQKALVISLPVGACCGHGCGLLLVPVRDDRTKQGSDDGDGRRDDPRHNAYPITR